MLFLYIVFIFVLIIWGIKFEDNDDFISKERCNSIKGIFILLIVLTHSMQYINNSGYEYEGIDMFVPFFKNKMGQMVVVMFLFYSGYGVYLSIKKKGKAYVNQMPRRRLLTTLLNFDVAVLSFVVLNLFISKPMSISQVALSMIGWDSVGNSNWYIFDILVCYTATYIVAKLSDEKNLWKWLFFLIFICVIVLSFLKKSYWYNTMMAYPAGVLFAAYQNRIVAVFRKYYLPLLILLGGTFFVTFYQLPKMRGISDNIASICFALIVVLLTMKIIVENDFLKWCGEHLFPLYIYQRLSMIVMYDCFGSEFVKNHAMFFPFIALLVTCLISRFYNYWQIKMN